MTRAATTTPTDLPRQVTLDEYFAIDREADIRHEFYGNGRTGQIIAMAGGTSSHSLITLNVGAELRQRLRGTPCRVHSPDKRIGTASHPSYTYPDVSVICGPEQVDPRDPDSRTAINPTLVVEVLSPSTERDDRGRKFARYLTAASLAEYVLVAQDEPRVETYFRQADGTWLFTFAAGLDAVVRLRSVGVDLPLAEVYLNVTFPPPAEPAAAPPQP